MATTVPAGSLRPARSNTLTVALGHDETVPVTMVDQDRTRPFLVLHGGGGPATVAGFASLLAERTHSRVLMPTHPGFGGTPRPDSVASTRDLAAVYVGLLDDLDLSDVTVIGSSFGGWLAVEIGLLGSPRVSGIVVVDGIGAVIEGHPITDASTLTPAELAQRSFHDPSRVPLPPTPKDAPPSPDILALVAYAGPTMADPTLLARLAGLELPVHVLWGESDGIVDPGYGRAYAAAIPISTFTLLPRTGHLAPLETPEELLGAIFDLGLG